MLLYFSICKAYCENAINPKERIEQLELKDDSLKTLKNPYSLVDNKFHVIYDTLDGLNWIISIMINSFCNIFMIL